MEHKRVTPHDNGNCIVAVGKAVSGGKQPFGARENPDAEEKEKIDKVAEVSKKVVVTTSSVEKEPDRHEVDQLNGIPVMEVFWERADEISTDEYV